MIYVLDELNCKFLPVPALDQGYTHHLTVWQHHIIRRYARQCVQTHVDLAALCRAKDLIQQIVEGERLLEKNIGGMQGIAHYLNIGQPNYEISVQPPELPRASDLYQLPPQQPTPDIEASVHTRSNPETSSIMQFKENDRGVGSDEGQVLVISEEGWAADYDLPAGE
jgi:hypothetical protein